MTSNERKPWSKVHRDHKTVIDGVRMVIVLNPATGATELVPWKGPA
jgi:hypothetical protein